MSFFYYDSIIRENEEKLNFTPIIKHLESLFQISSNVDILVTLIGATWFYHIEGNVNQSPIDYDWEFYQNKWKQYIDFGCKNFNDCEKFCYIAGYTLGLHGFYIGENYEKNGLTLMKKCFKICEDDNLKALAQNFIENAKINNYAKYITLDNAVNICKELFPNNSMLDMYFKEIFLKRN